MKLEIRNLKLDIVSHKNENSCSVFKSRLFLPCFICVSFVTKIIILFIFFLMVGGCSSLPLPQEHILIYKTIDKTNLRMDIFNPPNHHSTDNRPCILFFHGGGWKGGAFDQLQPHSKYFSSRGMVGINVEYRVETIHKTSPLECVKDAKSAFRWVRKNAKKLGIDSNKIVGCGGSAGGHIVAVAGSTDGLDEVGEDMSFSSKPNAMVLFNPVLSTGTNGYGYNRVKDYWEEISPIHNINKKIPSTVLFFGTDDKHIPVALVNNYKNKLKEKGVRCDLHFYEGQPHGFFNYKKNNGKYYYKTVIEMDKFLESLGYIKGKPTLKKITKYK